MEQFEPSGKKSFFKRYLSEIIITSAVALSIIVLSVVAIAANTVPYTVIDGDKSYQVSTIFPEASSLADKAEEEGMPEFTELDDAVIDTETSTMTIYRAVNVTLNIDGETKIIHANVGQTLGSALKEADVNQDRLLKVYPIEGTVIEGDMDARLTNGYIVKVNGCEYEVMGEKVGDALLCAGIKIDSDDKVSPSINENLTSGLDITFTEGFKVTITNGSFSAETSTHALTVGEFLEEREITLDEDDKLSLPASAPIENGTEIVITRVYTVSETYTETVAYGTDYEPSVRLIWGGTKLKSPGENGTDKVTYSCTYENGVLVTKEEINRETIKAPVNEIILERATSNYQEEIQAAVIGNSGSGDNYFIDHDGNKVYYKKIIRGEATAYCIPDGITSVGLPVGVGIVAVDPKIIPYGSLLYIETANHLYGYGIAGDTGGAMLSGRVLTDLYMDTIEDCSLVGRCRVKVYIIE